MTSNRRLSPLRLHLQTWDGHVRLSAWLVLGIIAFALTVSALRVVDVAVSGPALAAAAPAAALASEPGDAAGPAPRLVDADLTIDLPPATADAVSL